jgi:serine/threonine protein phosphatase 1
MNLKPNHHQNGFYQTLTTNNLGRDYFVGDIHGRFDELMDALDRVDFNFETDRLISVGDLVDRGDQSEKVVGLIDQPWFYAVRGNHDQFILDQYEAERVMLYGDYSHYSARDIHRQVCCFEADWFYALSEKQQFALASKLMRLAYVIELDLGSMRIGVCHAGVPLEFDDWQAYLVGLADRNVRELTLRNRHVAQNLNRGVERQLKGIDFTLHGHSCFPKPLFGKQCGFIDTFDRAGVLTLICADEIVEKMERCD